MFSGISFLGALTDNHFNFYIEIEYLAWLVRSNIKGM